MFLVPRRLQSIESQAIDWSNPVDWSAPLNRGLEIWWHPGAHPGKTSPDPWATRLYDLCSFRKTVTKHGTLTNSPVWTTSVPGTVLQFTDSSTQYVAVTLTQYTLNSRTFAFSCKRNVGSANNIVGWNNETNRSDIKFTAATTIVLRDMNGSGNATATGTVSNDGQWHYYVISCDNGTILFTEDGRDVTTDGTMDAGLSIMIDGIANRPGGSVAFGGLIGDLRIYNRPLSLRETEALYRSWSTGYQSELRTNSFTLPSGGGLLLHRRRACA